MRSYAACLLFSDVVDYPVVLIDEPETFLHASAARILAQHLVASTVASRRQVFLSVHSGDVIRGLLDSGQQSVTIVRLEREGNVNRAMTLDAGSVKTWRVRACRSGPRTWRSTAGSSFRSCLHRCNGPSLAQSLDRPKLPRIEPAHLRVARALRRTRDPPSSPAPSRRRSRTPPR
jgi:hypothetical protein